MTHEQIVAAGAGALHTPWLAADWQKAAMVVAAVEPLIRADERRLADAERDLAVADRERFDDERLVWQLRARQAEELVADLREQLDRVGR